jgi:DNA polymerase-3 subunit epsilon
LKLLEAPLAIVDVETTGAHPRHDRVTEIAVLEVERGELAGEWETLVDPEEPIPAAIQALTGISNAMVEDAPTFAELAPALHERLAGRVLVAHNARFDYGFLRREFERAGLPYQARTLCTVKLSRRLYPEHARHDLDSLIARHALECGTRHRALGDARALWQFLRIARDERGAAALDEAALDIARRPALPAWIGEAAVDAIPDAPGVYTFYGESGQPLYVGKSLAMRSRVMQHFSGSLGSAREQEIARRTRSIDWTRTAGELGALLLECERVKSLRPAFNRQLSRTDETCGFWFDGKALSIREAKGLEPGCVAHLHGLFRSKRAALEALRGLADEHGLCLQTLGFEVSRKGGCFRQQLRRCSGVCAGKESVHAHLARTAAALARLKTHAWPWRGPVGVVEEDPEREAAEIHVLEHWCWLGTARSEPEVGEILARGGERRFDLDRFRILARHLSRPGTRVLELS